MSAAVIPINKSNGSLNEILEHLGALLDTLDMVASDDERNAIEAEINAVCASEVRKVDGIAGYLAHCEAQQEFAVAEIKRLQARKALYAGRQERLEQYCIRVLEEARLKTLEGRTWTLSLRACPSSVKILDESEIPAAYKITKTEVLVDKKAVKAALEADWDVPGADLIFGRHTLVRR